MFWILRNYFHESDRAEVHGKRAVNIEIRGRGAQPSKHLGNAIPYFVATLFPSPAACLTILKEPADGKT